MVESCAGMQDREVFGRAGSTNQKKCGDPINEGEYSLQARYVRGGGGDKTQGEDPKQIGRGG